eukprot:TRINITY_DN9746_c0_g1_i1.p1 TRINITY_DN9746_c0_g1~~TRINITY_DN9746_c0_g1_i1.p1  ORF type:complete len:131 (-),score=6.15 TRINITY_DN9746_c0_g1_i1:1-393(-)
MRKMLRDDVTIQIFAKKLPHSSKKRHIYVAIRILDQVDLLTSNKKSYIHMCVSKAKIFKIKQDIRNCAANFLNESTNLKPLDSLPTKRFQNEPFTYTILHTQTNTTNKKKKKYRTRRRPTRTETDQGTQG